MAPGALRFGPFAFDPADRRLSRDGAPVAINGRYLDALGLLVRDAGTLVTKDRFMAEVWRGVPVTDEALTQCIRSLRRELGDDAARPRYIQTVPKHGYRFIARVESVDVDGGGGDDFPSPATGGGRSPAATIAAGTAGGVAAGLLGGLIYGAVAASATAAEGGRALSVLLVVTAITAAVALLGAGFVSAGIALARRTREASGWRVVLGGAAGGFLVGALVRIVALDAFGLLLGAAPRDITGGGEGALLGAAAGIGVWLAGRGWSVRRAAAAGALLGGLGGTAIAVLGGRLLGGSLSAFAERFPGSRVRLDALGPLFGEGGFGPVTAVAAAAGEAALFTALLVAGVAARGLGSGPGRVNRGPTEHGP